MRFAQLTNENLSPPLPLIFKVDALYFAHKEAIKTFLPFSLSPPLPLVSSLR